LKNYAIQDGKIIPYLRDEWMDDFLLDFMEKLRKEGFKIKSISLEWEE